MKMNKAIISMMIVMTSLAEVGCRRRIHNLDEATDCHGKCSEFNCACEDEDWELAETQCIPFRWLCDAQQDCSNNADELDCICPLGQRQCGSDRGGDVEDVSSIYNCIDRVISIYLENNCWDRNFLIFNYQIQLSSSEENNICRNPLVRCNGYVNCPDGSDEMNCDSCPPEYPNRCACNQPDKFTCGKGWACFADESGCDGKKECVDGSDENSCAVCKGDLFTCDCYKAGQMLCRGRGCIPMSARCNGVSECSDGSDEKACTTCRDGLFACDCVRNRGKPCQGYGCILSKHILDGYEHCEDGSDEQLEYFKTTRCGDCDVTIRRFNTVEQCDVYTDCDNSTCVAVLPLTCSDYTKCSNDQVVCSSSCNKLCNSVFQCENGHLETAQNFCDGKRDCSDESDELVSQPGFKCSASFGRCVLPQRNLHDDVAQCSDGSDLCSHIPCFECLDGRLIISQNQLCDGIIDCFDLSDECLCDVNLRKRVCEEKFILGDSSQPQCCKVNPRCRNIISSSIETAQCQPQLFLHQSNAAMFVQSPLNLISCQAKAGKISAVTCDGRPECRDFSDECFCEDPPSLCNDRCHDFYQIGDRYCDGIIDEAWKFINNPSCPEGFDEKSCPQRFTCKAGNLVNIDLVQVCDGRIDCDDGSDEVDCSKESSSREAIFSSQTEMIERIELRIMFWFISLLVIIGNFAVIYSTTRLLCKEKMSQSQTFNNILLINLSTSDFLMGIYLLIISVKSVQYSGVYGDVDYQWRSSLECSIIGSFAVISSETSCFIMTILTAFRLYNVVNPFTARTASTLKWRFAIVLAWLVSLVLALLPVLKATSNYFVHEVWFSNNFTSREGWKKTDVMTFACRLASLSNQTIELNGDAWESTKQYLRNNFPEYSPLGEVGYYGETSICMPRIYTSPGDQSWVYSLVIITFNFISFMFVAISYLLIYCKASNRPIQTRRSDEQATQMQRRIARLIATDFACWIPICIMVFLKVGGVEISNLVYIVTAGMLLPINSAINPVLYSPIVTNYFGKLCS